MDGVDEPALTFQAMLPQVETFIRRIKITENDPALILDWNSLALDAFVMRANALAPGQDGVPPAPVWLTVVPPAMTPLTLVDDVMRSLTVYAGGRVGHVMLAPNDFGQLGRVVTTLMDIEMDRFMQACMVGAPADERLCVTSYLLSNKVLAPKPANRPAWCDGRQIFA